MKKRLPLSIFIIAASFLFVVSAAAIFIVVKRSGTAAKPPAAQAKVNNFSVPVKHSVMLSGVVSSGEIPVLMYHHIGTDPVGADAIRKGLTVLPQDFIAQLTWLKQQGYTSISLQNLYDYSQGKFTLPPKPVVFNFDDGYDDALTTGANALKQFGFTGSFGIITSFPGTTNGNNTYATWAQIKQAKQEGMEIVCHTENHFDGSNPKFDAGYIYQNLYGCRQTLSANLGSFEPFLIYPYGHYTQTYLTEAQAVGFVMGLKEGGVFYNKTDNIMEVPRIAVRGGETLQRFIDILTGRISTSTATSTLEAIKK